MCHRPYRKNSADRPVPQRILGYHWDAQCFCSCQCIWWRSYLPEVQVRHKALRVATGRWNSRCNQALELRKMNMQVYKSLYILHYVKSIYLFNMARIGQLLVEFKTIKGKINTNNSQILHILSLLWSFLCACPLLLASRSITFWINLSLLYSLV